MSIEQLHKELETIRREGIGVDDKEALPNVRCVGASILSPTGRPLDAVASQGPSVRMSPDEDKTLAPVVRAAAEELARVMPAVHEL